MPTIEITNLKGETSTLKAGAGETLMEALRDNGYSDVEAICGGVCSCSTCHIYVSEEWFDTLGERSEDEDQLIRSTDHFKENSRLSCQITLADEMDGLTLQIAEQTY